MATVTAQEYRLDVLQRGANNASEVLAQLIESGVFGEEARPKAITARECLTVIAETPPQDEWIEVTREASDALESATSPEATLEIYRTLIEEVSDSNEVNEGFRAASAIIEDGISQGLYYPGQDLFQELASGGMQNTLIPTKSALSHATDLAVADGKGALDGAVRGCVAGVRGAGAVGCGAGAIGGAVAGAVGNSATELIEKVWKYLRF
jgi:hypothetical protein